MAYTIIIPVFNQADLVERCLRSVLSNTPLEHLIVVVDDASTEGRIAPLLDELQKLRERNFIVMHHEDNEGFIGSVNDALRFTALDDVIILNSDTQVPPNWVERLDQARRAYPKVGAVCPVSNYATIFSVPNAGSNNLPSWLSVEQMDRIIEETSNHEHPIVPVVMGFCMLLTREMLNEVGLLDEGFGKGYGEEVDLCLRAREKGFNCVLADDLFVWHQGQASFGDTDETKAERAQGIELIKERYPDYEAQIRGFLLSGTLRAHKIRIMDRLRPRDGKKKIKVLHLLHHYQPAIGGTEVVTRRLIQATQDDCEHSICYLAPNQATDAHIGFDEDGALRIQANPMLVDPTIVARGYALEGEALRVDHWFRQVLEGLRPDIVHIQHLAGWGSFKLPAIAAEYSKVVMTLHDEYLSCPVFKLGGSCPKRQCLPDNECLSCIKQHIEVTYVTSDADILGLLVDRAAAIQGMMVGIDQTIAPSNSIANRISASVIVDDVRVIPHGVPPLKIPQGLRQPSPRLRVAWVGLASEEKGWASFYEAAKALKDDPRFEFHVMGYVDPSVQTWGQEHVKFHGAYQPEELPFYLQQVDVAIPACMRSESYGIVIDECINAGCRVIVPRLPVLNERMGSGLVGFVAMYPWGDSRKLIECITQAAREEPYHPEDLVNQNTLERTAKKHLEVYRQVLLEGMPTAVICYPRDLERAKEILGV